ncbi:RNA-binding protein [Streptomyces sp. AC627_RSS907]|uniref:RNA recognition motif domain-containing protein n=1 Tax=Streptomyces sp. AC627_RSS907 TaxID=2823684 RepID=UPI001C23C5A3|nr:RNA-binding protein [Streptomyces sp. AC627_RSS907]
MSATLRVGNLAQETTDDTLRTIFSDFGHVLDSAVMRDRDTGQSRGFALVTMSLAREAEAAIEGLNDTQLDGQQITVEVANVR